MACRRGNHVSALESVAVKVGEECSYCRTWCKRDGGQTLISTLNNACCAASHVATIQKQKLQRWQPLTFCCLKLLIETKRSHIFDLKKTKAFLDEVYLRSHIVEMECLQEGYLRGVGYCCLAQLFRGEVRFVAESSLIILEPNRCACQT